VAVLREEARSGQRSADRVRASVALLNYTQRFQREQRFEQRLRAVEERLGIAEPGVGPPASANDGSQDDDAVQDDDAAQEDGGDGSDQQHPADQEDGHDQADVLNDGGQ
jgi:hypothetical protein